MSSRAVSRVQLGGSHGSRNDGCLSSDGVVIRRVRDAAQPDEATSGCRRFSSVTTYHSSDAGKQLSYQLDRTMMAAGHLLCDAERAPRQQRCFHQRAFRDEPCGQPWARWSWQLGRATRHYWRCRMRPVRPDGHIGGGVWAQKYRDRLLIRTYVRFMYRAPLDFWRVHIERVRKGVGCVIPLGLCVATLCSGQAVRRLFRPPERASSSPDRRIWLLQGCERSA